MTAIMMMAGMTLGGFLLFPLMWDLIRRNGEALFFLSLLAAAVLFFSPDYTDRVLSSLEDLPNQMTAEF